MMGYEWSYDWLVATLAWDMSIADIKQLVLNSFKYSGMSVEDRRFAIENWDKDWEEYIKWLSRFEVKIN